MPTAGGGSTLRLGDRFAELWADETMGWLQVFTGGPYRGLVARRGADDLRAGRLQRRSDP